jgi:hypothetical protein
MSEDFLAVVEAKRFLGREFLTWLVHRIEEGDGGVEHEGVVTELQLGDRVVLAGASDERLTVVGAGDMRAEIGAGLQRGKLIDRARLVLVRGERRWELTLDGGLLAYEAVRCPPLDRGTPPSRKIRAPPSRTTLPPRRRPEDALGVLDRLFADFAACAAPPSGRLPRPRAARVGGGAALSGVTRSSRRAWRGRSPRRPAAPARACGLR